MKPTVEMYSFADCVNFEHIDMTARKTAEQLCATNQTVVAGLTPDDGTQYHIVISPPLEHVVEVQNGRSFTEGTAPTTYRLVGILTPTSNMYYWNGLSAHASYIENKWNINIHTANVLAAFLSLVSYYMNKT